MISAILLAAGRSNRMGVENKLLLPWQGKALIRHPAEQLLAAGVDEVVVVLGHEAERVKAALADCPLRFVFNTDYPSGMTSSIQAGVAALAPECQALIICPGDMPLLTAGHFEALVYFFREKKKEDAAPIVRPLFESKTGHPALFDAAYIPDLLACREREGCREVVAKNSAHLFAYQSADPAFYIDIDNREDYQRVEK